MSAAWHPFHLRLWSNIWCRQQYTLSHLLNVHTYSMNRASILKRAWYYEPLANHIWYNAVDAWFWPVCFCVISNKDWGLLHSITEVLLRNFWEPDSNDLGVSYTQTLHPATSAKHSHSSRHHTFEVHLQTFLDRTVGMGQVVNMSKVYGKWWLSALGYSYFARLQACQRQHGPAKVPSIRWYIYMQVRKVVFEVS